MNRILYGRSGTSIEWESSSSRSLDFSGEFGEAKLIAIIGDEDTCVGFVLAGIGELDDTNTPNYFVVDQKTDDFKVELAFLDLLERSDIGLVLITREAAEKIAPLIKQHTGLEPTVLIIPGHHGPYEFDLPLAVHYIEEKRKLMKTATSKRLSSSSVTSVKSMKSVESLHAKVSTHSLRSMRSVSSRH